jgi:hypothetical protein
MCIIACTSPKAMEKVRRPTNKNNKTTTNQTKMGERLTCFGVDDARWWPILETGGK